MEIFGYLGALLVGLSLGIFGAGGSIITIPVLIYCFRVEPLHATTYSFFIVGSTALIGAVRHIAKGTVKVMPALYFAVSGIIVIYLIRTFVIQFIPEVLFTIHNTAITKELMILLFFAVVMTLAGISMIRSESNPSRVPVASDLTTFLSLSMLGLAVGIVIAFAGVGGGFLITPALVLFARLPVKTAIGTSLCIICINSFVGFFSSFHLHSDIDWQFLFVFISITAAGILMGAFVSKKINSEKLRRVFGWFVLLMGIFIILNELFLNV